MGDSKSFATWIDGCSEKPLMSLAVQFWMIAHSPTVDNKYHSFNVRWRNPFLMRARGQINQHQTLKPDYSLAQSISSREAKSANAACTHAPSGQINIPFKQSFYETILDILTHIAGAHCPIPLILDHTT